MAGENNGTAKAASTEENTDEVLEESNAATETNAAEADAKGGEGEEEPAPKATPEKKDDGKTGKQPWYLQRINTLTAKERRTAAENEALKAALAARDAPAGNEEEAEGAETKTKPEKRALTEEDVERLADEKAAKKLAENTFNRESNKIFDAGVKEFSTEGFKEALDMLNQVSGELSPNFVEALMELDFPQRVIMALADDPDEAGRILALSPIRMAAALAKVKPKDPPKKASKISGAPDPIVPVGGGNKGGKSYEEMSDEEYAEARDAELAKKQGRR